MEVEAKFRASPDVFAALLALEALGPFALRPQDAPEQQHNTYYDTADRRLRATKHGLRVRRIGEREIATLKGQAVIEGGLHSRDEWEVDVVGDDPHAWPAGELRDRVFKLIGDMPLQPIVVIHTSRQHVYAFDAQTPFAEISLDQGVMGAANNAEPFYELEVELLPNGDRATFDMLVKSLRELFALEVEPRSKLERALLLQEKEQTKSQNG